jgi:hypothetical protein
MARRILKYRLQIADSQFVSMPAIHRMLDVQVQRGTITLWTDVDEESPARKVKILCFGTGTNNPGPEVADEYIATVQDGVFVWHFFEASS